MMLNPLPLFPSAGRYVLRLNRDAQPEAGRLVGRIEHVSSGDSVDFASSTELIVWLSSHASAALPGSTESATDIPPKETP
jgi:hypothetical protein